MSTIGLVPTRITSFPIQNLRLPAISKPIVNPDIAEEIFDEFKFWIRFLALNSNNFFVNF